MVFFAFKSMPQAAPFQVDFPSPPTLGEHIFALALWWLIGLAMIATGAYALYRSKNALVILLAALSLAFGFGACFLLGFSFTLLNHHRFAWSEDDPNINRWINICLVLMIWGTSLLSFWVGRKMGKLIV
jgi:hypothetical protein